MSPNPEPYARGWWDGPFATEDEDNECECHEWRPDWIEEES